jgi:uncharacterized phage protein (TIGR02216 family)
MEIGLGHLRLAPQDFWRMTLPELAAAATALGFDKTTTAMTRRALDGLVRQFPDHQ